MNQNELINNSNLVNSMKIGAKYGFYLSLSLLVIFILFFASELSVSLGEFFFIVLFLSFLTIGAGSLIGLIVVGTFNLLNWVLAFAGTSVLSFLSILDLENGLFGLFSGWVNVAFLSLFSILLLVRKYLAKKSPIWLEKSVDEAIVTILASLLITAFAYFFQIITGTTLLGLS